MAIGMLQFWSIFYIHKKLDFVFILILLVELPKYSKVKNLLL